jgi:glutaredoxin
MRFFPLARRRNLGDVSHFWRSGGRVLVSDSSRMSLYQTSFCPYCERVRSAARRLGLDLPLRDIDEDSTRREELVGATGRQTVPCLRIEREDGSVEWMHESEDIVAYLEERFGA